MRSKVGEGGSLEGLVKPLSVMNALVEKFSKPFSWAQATVAKQGGLISGTIIIFPLYLQVIQARALGPQATANPSSPCLDVPAWMALNIRIATSLLLSNWLFIN